MKTVCVESPLKGATPADMQRNIEYAKACMLYVLRQGCSPYVSHLLLTQVWDDADKDQREAGIAAGLFMGDRCEERWVFIDFGISEGMQRGIDAGERLGQEIRHIHLSPTLISELLQAARATEGMGG